MCSLRLSADDETLLLLLLSFGMNIEMNVCFAFETHHQTDCIWMKLLTEGLGVREQQQQKLQR